MSLLQEYKNSLKKIEVEEVFDLYFYRPIAFLLVKVIYHTSITPNQLTVLSMVFGIIGALFYSYGTKHSYILGAIFILMYNIVDCSDGQLARLKKNGTPAGRILDGISDYVVSTATYFGIAFGHASNSSNPIMWWIITAAAGFSNALQAGLLDFYRTRYLDYVLNRVSVLDEGLESFEEEYQRLKTVRGRFFDKFVIWIYLKYSLVQQKVTSSKTNKEKERQNISAEVYAKMNRKLIHLWTLLGTTTQWTFLIVTSFLNRLDLYLLGILIIWNLLAIVLYYMQSNVDSKLKLK
ncbi:MAG: CDP-alcohol phosphatidyltransferase family protein [Ignavibacteriaceae bacterium]|nr:CDP-alcohol phosphatidyltransferase family protein [Ignavibacteriaceae bacterium]